MNMDLESSEHQEEEELPQCKIKRNYSCSHCLYLTQNPRFYLSHLRDVHGERLTINNCSLCLYASRHYQKLVRHMKMVHGSTIESIRGQSRKRQMMEDVVSDFTTSAFPPLPPPPKFIIDLDSLSYDLKSSRKTLRDIFAICSAENDIQDILDQMEASDVVEVVPIRRVNSPQIKPAKKVFGDPKFITEHEESITCDCGHISKCFSEAIIHENSCSISNEVNKESAPLDLSISSVDYDCTIFPTNIVNNKQTGSRNQSMENEAAVKDKDVDLGKKNANSLEDQRSYARESIKEDIKTEKSEENEVVTTVIKPKEEITPSHRKVFKCLRCSFWASTASRFHVHIVRHQNKKPFKCSLCTYRSNWRWDITKHIRLRSTRSQCHKNARVLMHGETDRRNYAKYNSCITLMKVSDRDDMKLKKCGEMAKSDDDSVGKPNELDGDILEEMTNHQKGKEDQQKLSASLDIALEHQSDSTSPLKDISLDDKSGYQTRTGLKRCFPRGCLILEYGENPVYRCNKCDFKHPNRDAVLVHVKMLHQDLLERSTIASSEACLKTKPIESASIEINKNTNAKDPEDSKVMPSSEENNSFPDVKSSNSDTESMTIDVENVEAITSPTKASLDSDDKAALKAIYVTPRYHNDANKMKLFAPFRCGHCHQVSNWKHVIQRHCRLKHFGSVRIEAIDRSKNVYPPIYRMLDLSINTENFPFKSPDKVKQEVCDDQIKSANQPCSIDPDKELTEKILQTKLKYSEQSQMTDQDTLQKPMPLNCKICPYVCKNKLSLNEHAKIHESSHNSVHEKSQYSDDKAKSVESPVGKKKISVKKKTLEKCPYCLFESSCHSALKCHEQSHYRVLNSSQKNSKTIQKNKLGSKLKKESQTSSHFKPTSNAALSNDIQKKENSTLIENTALKSDSEVKSNQKETMPMAQHSKTPSTNSNNFKKTSIVPPLSSQKTIFVNPKTGQIVRRN